MFVMYKRLTCLMTILIAILSVDAQLSVSLQEPPAGLVQKQQLWNLTLINTSNTPISVTIGLNLININDNQPVLTALTKPLSISKGVKQLKPIDISPVDYNYYSSASGRFSETFLPIGNYRACYTVYTGAKETPIVLFEDCVPIEVQPLSPPQLTMPADSASLQNRYPQFSWLPPTPVTLFSDLNYDLILTEVRSDQTASSAIQENMPVYNLNRLTTMVNNYPASARALDTGKVYAWRIIAKNGETFAAQSEVWTFKISPEKPETITPVGGMYLELKNDQNYTSTAVIPDNILGIKYYSYDKTHETAIRFLNERGEVVKEIKKMVEYGNNFLVFKLDKSFATETTYFIEVSDLQLTKYRTSFRISK